MLEPMTQVVRFAATPAGRVAYSVTGSGPLVCLLGWVSHLGLMWENPEHRRFVEALAREHIVIRYDKLGCGLSDRARTDFTMESELMVLESLVEQLGLELAWAALGCPGGWAASRFGRVDRPAVLGRMAARLSPPIVARSAYIVVGWLESVSGRKLTAGSARYSSDGVLQGFSNQTWITLTDAGARR